MAACPFGCSDNSQCRCSQPLDFDSQIIEKESKPYGAFACLAACPFGCSKNSQCLCSQPLDPDTQIDSQVEEKEPQIDQTLTIVVGDPIDAEIVDDEPESAEPIHVDVTGQFDTDKVCLKVICNFI